MILGVAASLSFPKITAASSLMKVKAIQQVFDLPDVLRVSLDNAGTPGIPRYLHVVKRGDLGTTAFFSASKRVRVPFLGNFEGIGYIESRGELYHG